MIEPTLDKLQRMRMTTMAAAIRDLDGTAANQDLSWHERLTLVVDKEWLARENKQVAKRLKDAKLTRQASLENINLDAARGIEKPLLRELASGKWLESKQNLILIGATGTGKTYLASALVEHACRQGRRARFVRVPRLLEELAVARAEGTYATTLQRFTKFDLLVMDDFLMAPLSDVERRDILELLEDRYKNASTIFTSQTPTKTWHSAIGDPTIADAICDRIVHNAKHITLKGPSLRQTQK
jgi:DNA replication protein DnaC